MPVREVCEIKAECRAGMKIPRAVPCLFETEGTVEQCARMILWRKAQKAWTTGVVEATEEK
jgi:hypothetical protein